MKGNAGTTFRTGTRTGTSISTAMKYESTVPATITAGTRAGFMSTDYTPAMKRFTGVLTLFLALAVQGCIASTVVLHVMPDGRGQAAITTRMYEAGFDA